MLEEKSRIECQKVVARDSALKASLYIGQRLNEWISIHEERWRVMSCHRSNIVREWAAIMVGFSDMKFSRKLAWIKPFADSDHPKVRDMACFALRHCVVQDPLSCIQSLIPWTGSRNEHLRRYACEITRPLGIRTSHIVLLQEQPDLAIGILEPLRADDSRYVRNSMVNWLKDVSHSKPDWVRELLLRWSEESGASGVQNISKRVLRILKKNDRC
jgi:3-methyladenine DNA glycosylase AlkC